MKKHTTGPWVNLGSAIGVAWQGQGGEQDQLLPIALLPKPDADDSMDEWKANASLIAAAPDLLAALEHVLDRATMPGFLRDKVKAAIAKATGDEA